MERLHVVDALRALALLGILAVNIWYFAYPENLTGGGRTAGLPAEDATSSGAASLAEADTLVAFASTVIFEGKSYVVFSFLFGLSFVLQWSAAHRARASEVTRSVRRFTGLAVLGVLHGLLLFVGDILLAYAVLGFALLGARRIRTRTALLLAGALWSVIVVSILALGVLSLLVESAQLMEPSVPGGAAQQARAAYTGGLGSYLGFQLSAYALVMPSTLLVQGPMAFAAFLVGLVIGRHQVVERIIRAEPTTARLVPLMLACLAVGGGLSVAAAWILWGAAGGGAGAELLGTGLIFLGGPIQAAGYVLAGLLILRRRGAGWLVRVLAPAGRMSLSNYLGQSLVLAVIFSAVGTPLGLGLAGELGGTQVGAVVVVLWLSQLGLSHAWLRIFPRGPVETPLRAWTYARRPPRNHPSA